MAKKSNRINLVRNNITPQVILNINGLTTEYTRTLKAKFLEEEEGSIGGTEMAEISIVAGEDVTAGKLVSLYDNKIWLSDKDNTYRSNFVGITKEDGLAGHRVNVVTQGIVYIDATLPNGPVWMDSDGALSVSVPSTGTAIMIGHVVDRHYLILEQINKVILS